MDFWTRILDLEIKIWPFWRTHLSAGEIKAAEVGQEQYSLSEHRKESKVSIESVTQTSDLFSEPL